MKELPKIIYVDDENTNTLLFKLNFSDDYNALTGSCGLEGLKLLDEHPDTQIIISDMKMPNMSGLDFIRKAKEKYPEKKYYLFTGYDINEEIEDALASGLIIDCFKKPCTFDVIKDLIQTS